MDRDMSEDGVRMAVDAALAAHESAVASVRDMVPELTLAAGIVTGCIRAGGKVLACGNGGSAADAQHLAAEFVGRFLKERTPWPALALSVNSSAVTAIGNDYGFEEVFARQVRALGRPGDVLIAISTGGVSPNVLRAVQAAREAGMPTIGLAGGRGSLAAAADVCLSVLSAETPRIQETHILLLHLLCGLVEDACC